MKLEEAFNLDDDETRICQTKKGQQNKLAFAFMLKYFQIEGKYPKNIKSIDITLIKCIANQLMIDPNCIKDFDWGSRSIKRFRQEIRNHLGFREATLEDGLTLKNWLIEIICPQSPTLRQCLEHAYQYFKDQKIEPLSPRELERHVRSAYHNHENQLFSQIYNQMSEDAKNSIDDLLIDNQPQDDDEIFDIDPHVRFYHIKKDIPGSKLKHVKFEIKKLQRINLIGLPNEVISKYSRKLIKKYHDRVLAEPPSDITSHKSQIQYATLALFFYYRSQYLTDCLADLFMQLIHKMKTSSENFINKKIVSEVKRVNGKFDILYLLANVSVSHPDGIISETIYPQVGKDKLFDLINDLDHKGKWYQNQVQIKTRSLYSHAHRVVLLRLLESFTFKSNTPDGNSILEAIELIKEYRDDTFKYFPSQAVVSIKNVVPNEWHAHVIEASDNSSGDQSIKVNRINYEIAVLEELRKTLRCKSIWIVGAYRFRNPDEDLPQDFDENREHYFKLMALPSNANDFVKALQDNLDHHLKLLNNSILCNDKVKIMDKHGGRIKLAPSDPQIEPANLGKLHKIIQQRWSTINLIDILKETDLRIGFTDQFHTVASRENITKDKLQKRLLLCLYGIGSNTGLKRVSAANDEVNYSDLRYVKRRFINTANVRAAIVDVVNQILEIRDPRIWGEEATTGVACDSTKVSAWDQNLMTEWHTRYKGRGVMIYWHIDRKSTCIYSQLKTCSSSEVGSMIKGILHHCTMMEIDQAYVDTHGQSTVGFGISHLLNFDLLPRLKNLNKQKLYYSSHKHKDDYPHLADILKEPINWNRITENYDSVVKHCVSLKTGIVDPDVLIKRFSTDNYDNPVYKAFAEIGKAVKTIFLCRYLISEELRIEIHESLNVVERLNSIMGFIFYGKLGEISTNVREDQELAVVCLHLLQVCMSYINTLIIQEALSEPEWEGILTVEDKRGLSPLIHAHINPYGLFPLDLDQRLEIAVPHIGKDDEPDSDIAIEDEIAA